MAEALTGQAQAKQILTDLNQRHYFTQKHESHPVFYQYHPLFREFLQTRGRERFNITELSEIKNRASVIMAENGQIEDAVTLMVKSENWFALIPMIISHAPALISQGRNQTLDTWIQSLPPPQIQENPWLLYWLGVCRLPFSPLESGGLFEEAFNSFRTGKDAAGIYLSLAGLFDFTTYGMGDFKAYDRWPWPLKIFTLGTFDLVKEGESLEFPVKAPRKMFSFLKVLVASGGKGLSEEQLTEALWPEADGDMAHQAFATTLHRLRQLLGDEKAIHLRKGILKFDERYCYVDPHVFEYLVQQADALNDVALLQKAVALYTGLFLGGDNSDPLAISYQEKLRSKFLRAVAKLGQFFEKNGDQEEAIACYQKGLEVDGFAEEFYQRLMLCYQASGRKAEALSVYDRFRGRLRSVLGVEPSPKTQAIYETIRKKC